MMLLHGFCPPLLMLMLIAATVIVCLAVEVQVNSGNIVVVIDSSVVRVIVELSHLIDITSSQ